jgi:AraC-like DNA-binding protein
MTDRGVQARDPGQGRQEHPLLPHHLQDRVADLDLELHARHGRDERFHPWGSPAGSLPERQPVDVADVGDLAARAGFSDQSQLTRHFKDLVGDMPGAVPDARKNRQERASPAKKRESVPPTIPCEQRVGARVETSGGGRSIRIGSNQEK